MNVDVALADLAREHSGRVLAILAAKVGLDVADDAVQDALVEAARTWPRSGVPGNPPGWLMTVARRKAIDRQRRASSSRRQLSAAAAQLVAADAERDAPDRNESTMIDDTFADAGTDEQLRLMLLCCHPALDPDAQVALTLRLVGGLSTPEIAAAYLVPEATLAQRIVRRTGPALC